MLALLCANPVYGQKPLKRPPKPNTSTNTTIKKPAQSKPKPAKGYINGHEWVDLGLSVKWATCNVGASSPSDYGNYYAWGETRTKSRYDEDNSVTYNMPQQDYITNRRLVYDAIKDDYDDLGSFDDFNEKLDDENNRRVVYDAIKDDYDDVGTWNYFNNKLKQPEAEDIGISGAIGASIAGNSSYDAARANWGGTWRLPTWSEIDELVDKCTRTWTTINGHSGYKVTGPNGNSIFLPAAGYRNGTSLFNAGEIGSFWSATPYGDDSGSAYCLTFGSGDFVRNWGHRLYGQTVRPVSE
ncbi:MAG: DUF1566 domain-containing protein [Prevotella sp.]|nr:DUF1566 domain-containing protein [Prevotella sp.]